MEQHAQTKHQIWARTFSRVGISALIIFGMVYVTIQFIQTPERAIKQIAEGFSSGKVTEEFRDYVTKIQGVNHLQVAKLSSLDTFSRTDSQKILWDRIGLPDVKVEIQAPVEYTFYLDLKDSWEFQWHDDEQAILILAPAIQSNTPAIDVSNMVILTEKGSILRDEDEVHEKLKQELTELSKQMAVEKIPLIREIARNETRQFIENWFIKVRFSDAAIKPHVQMVKFADEYSLQLDESISSQDNL